MPKSIIIIKILLISITRFLDTQIRISRNFVLKKKAFCIKITIYESKKDIKYVLLYFCIIANQGSNLDIINPKLVKQLRYK